MAKFSDNYYLRECFLKREQVPTQSVMIKKMSPPLAAVYFKSMTHKLKVLAGLEPPMKGGGTEWFMPPKDLLEGRAVLKPSKKEYLSKLNYLGIDYYGMKDLEIYHKKMEEERNRVILESDMNWKKKIEVSCRQQYEKSSKEAAKRNTELILNAFNEFTTVYTTSIANIELLLYEAAVKKIQSVEEEVFQRMALLYETELKQQATTLYDIYTEKLMRHKARLKAEFIENIEHCRTDMGDRIHDINVEKHVAIEKLRKYLECQNLACQVYVALKERDECFKEIALSKHEHQKKVKFLTEQLAYKNFEILLAKEKEKKREEFNRIWKKKVCHVVKKFQLFVSYCLNTLPEYAEFFLNMEKLMLLQLSEALENSSVESIFVPEQEQFHTPVPKPHPFYLFCDKGYKVNVDQNLCPKRCTSSSSQLPVIIINKRCIYAACDNFEKFTEKIKEFIHGKRGDDIDFADHHIYEHDVPVRYASSMQLAELKLESSLLQVLQKELPNIKQVSVECCVCKIPHCFCSPLHASQMSLTKRVGTDPGPSKTSISSGNKIKTRAAELHHEREPKWESYFKHIEPKRCRCPKKAKKHLSEHLPPYMKNMSFYDEPELPNYERCSVTALKRLVEKARGKPPPIPPLPVVPSKTRDISTQYSDQEFDFLCTCFSDEEVKRLFNDLITDCKLFDKAMTAPKFNIVGDNVSSSTSKQANTFATDRAHSLKHLVVDAPELQEIFMKKDCKFKR